MKRVEAMIEFFTLILQLACSFKGAGICPVYDDDQLCRPLKKYLIDFVWRKMFGLQSYCVAFILCDLLQGIDVNIDNEINMVDVGAQNMVSMEELCQKSIDTFTKKEKISHVIINQVTTLCWSLDVAWRKLCNIQNIQNQITCQQNVLLRSKLILTAHFWMFEEVLTTQTGFTVSMRNRSSIMLQLDEVTRTLTAFQSNVQRQRDELLVLTTAIKQRLKWAVGANPNLMALMNEFVAAITTKDELIDSIGLLAAIALKECASILQYEKLRVSTPEAIEEDQKFLNLVSRWEKSCMMISCMTVVTPVEEALIELLDPEGPIDNDWLNNVAALIDEMIDQVQQDISKIEKEIANSQDELQSCAYRLRNLMANHHRIAPKILILINSLYRIVDEIQKSVINQYVERHNLLQDTINELQGHVMSKDFTEELVNTSLKQIAELIDTIKTIFNDLIDVEGLLSFHSDCDKKINVLSTPVIAQIQHQDNIASRPSSPSKTKAQKGIFLSKNLHSISFYLLIYFVLCCNK